MNTDTSLFTKRIRRLSFALTISGIFNIGILSFFLYWMSRERPPTPYCEHMPASIEQQHPPLADIRGCAEVLAQLSNRPFRDLIDSLSNMQLIENGYAERDLALAYIIAFHHFDIQRALSRNLQPQQQRFLSWQPKKQEPAINLVVYPGLTQEQFSAIIHFANTEKWPLTSEGLYLQLKQQKEKAFDDYLLETFILTPEFWTVELLFNRFKPRASKQEILNVLLEGNWMLLKEFVSRQKQVHDSSDALRQKFLLDYVKAGSPTAVKLLLKTEWDFAVKKLDDHQVASIINAMSIHLPEGVKFAKEMITSPRSMRVWKQSSEWLYRQSGELMPSDWTHHLALKRFVPEKASLELISKPVQRVPGPITPPLPMTTSQKTVRATPIKPSNVFDKEKIKEASKEKIRPIASTSLKKNSSIKKGNSTAPLFYTVQEGDTLWKLAKRFHVKIETIKELNQLKSDTLKTGTSLKIPTQHLL